jgi:hypothetical protein
MNSLSNNERFYIPNTLDGIDILTENIESNALLVDGTNFMMADLDAGGHNVKNVANATAIDEAINLGQLNSTLANYVDLTSTQVIGGSKSFSNQVTFNGTIKTNLTANDIPNAGTRTWLDSGSTQTISGTKIFSDNITFNSPVVTLTNGATCNNKNLTNVLNPSNPQDASTKNYTDTADGLRVLKAGDTMSGTLLMSGSNQIALNSSADIGQGKHENYFAGDWYQVCRASSATKGLIMRVSNNVAPTSAHDRFKINGNGDISLLGATTISNTLSMNTTNKIINLAEPTTSQDASTKNYVDTQSSNTNYLLRNGTLAMTGNLNMGTSYKITNLLDPTLLQDASTKNYVDTQTTNTNYLLRNGTLAMTGNLNMGTSYKITDLLDPTLLQDAVTKNYCDNSLNLLRAYVDSVDNADRAYVDASLNLKVNRAGDTMTGNLNISLAGATTNSNKQLNVQNNNNSIWFNPYFGAGSYNPLVTAGSKGIIFSNGTKETGDLVIGSWTDQDGGIQLNYSGQTYINKNSSGENNFVTSSSNILTLTDFNEDRLTLTYSGAGSTIILLVNAIGGLTTACGKSVNISIPTGKNIIFQVASGSKINYNGVEYTTQTPTISSNLAIIADNTLAGYYTSGAYKIWDSYDQLTLKSNLSTSVNTEVTGIRFLNSNAESGFIRVDTNKSYVDSNMSFLVRQANAITTPLVINAYINTYKPIIRNAWSSGELIQTKIYTQSAFGTGVLQINGGSGATTWKSLDFTMINNVTDSNLCVEVFAPYCVSGDGQDKILSQIRDFTSSTEQEILLTGQYWDANGGGGTRSGILLPMMMSYTPNLNTSNKTRKIEVRFNNYSNDILYICRIVNAGGIVADCNYWTIRVSEYKK